MLTYLTKYLKLTYNVLSTDPFQGGATICPVASYNFIGTLLLFNDLQPIPRDSNGRDLAAMLDNKINKASSKSFVNVIQYGADER